MHRYLSTIFALMLALGVIPAAFAQQTLEITVPVPSQELTGEIESVDNEAFLFEVRSYVDEDLAAYRVENFYAVKEAEIRQNDELIQFADLVPDMEVTVQYREGIDGKNYADKIWVLTRKDRY